MNQEKRMSYLEVILKCYHIKLGRSMLSQMNLLIYLIRLFRNKKLSQIHRILQNVSMNLNEDLFPPDLFVS